MNEAPGSGWEPEQDEGATQPDRESVVDLVRRLVQEGRGYAGAEAARQKLRFAHYLRLVIKIAVFTLIAIILLLGTLVALLVGLIVALAPHIGALWATVAVIGGAIVLVLLLLLAARAKAQRLALDFVSGRIGR